MCKRNKNLPCADFIAKDIFSKAATHPRVNFDIMRILNIDQKELLRVAINNTSDCIAKTVAYRHLFLHESLEEVAENMYYSKRTVERYYNAAKNAIIFELIKMLEAKSK